MIIRTEFIVLGGQAAHLLRTDTNRLVVVRSELSRNAPEDLLEATRTLAAISRTNRRTKRDLIHTKISPSHDMLDDELAHTLGLIETAYGISQTMPRVVVEHAKGDRANHFHVLWSLVDPDTGRAIKSNKNFLLDEFVSRRLEIEFGEAMTPGPRMADVADMMEAQDLRAEADVVRSYGPVLAGDRLDTASRQQASRLQVDATKITENVYASWTASEGAGRTFEAAIMKIGLRLAAGDKAVMVVQDETAFSAPLGRMLRQQAKAAGAPLKLPEQQIKEMFPSLPVLKDAKRVGLDESIVQGRRAVDDELRRFATEAEIDGNSAIEDRLRLVRARAKDQAAVEFRDTLKARREEIRNLYRRRDRIRRARVRRALIAADLVGTPEMQKLAFGAVASGVVLAGGGLGVALVIGGIAMLALPSRERARAVAHDAQLGRVADAARQRQALAEVYANLRSDRGAQCADDVTTIEGLSADRRRIAAYLAHRLVMRGDRTPRKGEDAAINSGIENLLGPDIAAATRRLVELSANVAVLNLLRCYNRGRSADRDAVRAALGLADLADPVAQISPHATVRAKKPAPGGGGRRRVKPRTRSVGRGR